MIYKILNIAAGGAIGALLRYIITHKFNEAYKSTLLGTLISNLTGCLLLGIFIGLSDKVNLGKHTQLLVITGFLGSFTTLSVLNNSLLKLLEENQYTETVIYMSGNIIGGIIFIKVGRMLYEIILK